MDRRFWTALLGQYWVVSCHKLTAKSKHLPQILSMSARFLDTPQWPRVPAFWQACSAFRDGTLVTPVRYAVFARIRS
jgi:hypothetical protein